MTFVDVDVDVDSIIGIELGICFSMYGPAEEGYVIVLDIYQTGDLEQVCDDVAPFYFSLCVSPTQMYLSKHTA